MQHFAARTRLPDSPEEVFRWHDTAGAVHRLVPPWAPVSVVSHTGRLIEGGQTTFELPLGMRWHARVVKVAYPEGFIDEQEHGPMKRWRHRHAFERTEQGGTMLDDRVEYELPGGRLGAWLGGNAIDRRLAALFRFRHERTRSDLARHAPYRERPSLRIAVSGTHGLVGSALAAFLRAGGHTVVPIVRGRSAGCIAWDDTSGEVDAQAMQDIDAVVHLAGESFFGLRWTAQKKHEIEDSRVRGTKAVATAAARAQRGPRVFVCASSVGYYGDRGLQVLSEGSPRGDGFLPDVVERWEAAAAPAREAGLRTVHLRSGTVLSGAGGALPMLMRASRWALAGPLGSGRQYVPWIALDDLLGAILFALHEDDIEGPVNVVSPHEITQRDLIAAVAGLVHRPVGPRVPNAALKAAMGQLATELLLPSERVRPTVLLGRGFAFRYGDLERALRFETGRHGDDHPTQVLTGDAAMLPHAA